MTNELYEMMNDKMISDIEAIATRYFLQERGMKDVKILMEELQNKYDLSNEKVKKLIRIRLKELLSQKKEFEEFEEEDAERFQSLKGILNL